MRGYNKLGIKKHSKHFSEDSFFDKVMGTTKTAGISVVYAGLLLFYTFKKTTTPGWAKAAIISSLGYFISPLDAIPDMIPIAGYSDDLGVLALAIGVVVMFIGKKEKQKSKEKLKEWFGEYDERLLEEVDNKINKK